MNTILLASLLALAPSGDVSPMLRDHAEAIAAAPGLSVEYKVTTVGGTSVEYSVKLAKPNLARIESPGKVWTADGQNVTVYDKGSNSYTVEPQDENNLMDVFDVPMAGVWATFFDAKGIEHLASSKDLGSKKLRGKTFNAVSIVADTDGTMSANVYLDPTDKMPRIIENTKKSGATTTTQIMDVSQISLEAVAATAFAFAPPAGATKVDVMASSGVWLHDFEEAQKLANATGKKIMVDFMASWCGPCKRMDAEVFQSERFKKEAKDFVLCKIDVDEQKGLAQRYNIEAMPTVKFIRGDGSVAHEFVGYGGPEGVYKEMAIARSK